MKRQATIDIVVCPWISCSKSLIGIDSPRGFLSLEGGFSTGGDAQSPPPPSSSASNHLLQNHQYSSLPRPWPLASRSIRPMPAPRETLLCHYHYDALDQLISHTLPDTPKRQRFYCKS